MHRMTGTVVSTAPDKTAIVRIDSSREHRIYRKKYRVSKRIAAHDPENKAKAGDIVAIEEIRPISKTKRFRLAEVVEEAATAGTKKEELQ